MASLRDTVKDYQDELRDGIAWVAFWKQGRSWNAEYFHLDMDDTLYPEDRSRLEEIKSTDPAAVILNGYYCGHLGEDMSLDELTAGVRYHYENSMNDIDGFIGAHDDRLPPEVIEEARAAAHEAGLPFSENPYRDGEDFNPYVFDGSMSIEDFELMHRMIEKERSEQMAEPILSGYLSNLGKYTEGRPAGEWVTFPTTAEHLKEVFDRIGIDFKHYEEWHFTEFQSTIPGLTEHLSEYSHPDELNYLGKLLEMQFDDDREKFIAAIEYGDHADSLQDIINLAQNLDCYWIYPSVHNEEEYGRYLVDELEEPELPEEAKKYFMYEEYGRDASINDDGMFTEKGYIYNNRNTFTEWYDGRDVPEEYRVTPQPPQRSIPDPEKVEMDAAELHPKSWTRKSTKGVQKSMGKELFSEELKLAVVQYVLEGHTRKEASEKFCVSCTPIEKWVNLYKLHGAKGLLSRNLVGRQKGFDGEFRLKVLQYKQEHHLSCTQTAMHFCLDVVTVCRWEKKFQKEGARGLMKKQATKGSEKRQKKQEQSELQQENKRLSEEIYRLRMENDYLKKLNALIQKREKPE